MREFWAFVFVFCFASVCAAQTISSAAKFDQTFKRQTANVKGVKIHYATAGTGAETIVLLHGFPETLEAWRKVAPALAARFRVVAPDLRGLGKSEKTASGYDKRTIAEDVYQLAKQLGHEKFYLVGHDFGGSTAYALAAAHPEAIKKLVAIECLPAGLLNEEETRQTVGKYFGNRAWFQAFHQVRDLPEQLTAGRENVYLNWLFDNFTTNKTAFPAREREVYLRAYSEPGAMRAALAYYRAQTVDFQHNQETMKTKLPMPILTIGGDGSFRDTTYLAFKKVADNVTGEIFENCGHFVADEQPEKLTAVLLQFLSV